VQGRPPSGGGDDGRDHQRGEAEDRAEADPAADGSKSQAEAEAAVDDEAAEHRRGTAGVPAERRAPVDGTVPVRIRDCAGTVDDLVVSGLGS
jgi:hypothetical protein